MFGAIGIERAIEQLAFALRKLRAFINRNPQPYGIDGDELCEAPAFFDFACSIAMARALAAISVVPGIRASFRFIVRRNQALNKGRSISCPESRTRSKLSVVSRLLK